MELLLWYENGPVGAFIRESVWGYPIVLSCHAVGMAAVLGIALILCMRVIGFAKGVSVLAFDRLFLVGWAGFILNLVSGVVLLAGSTSIYFFQWIFQLKLGAILAGGLLLKFLMNSVRANKTEGVQKMIAIACMISWLVGVVAGRLMAYVSA
jgi:hypothetical protein